jgi:heat shock protein HslJ
LVHAQTSRNLSTNEKVLAGSEWRLVSFGRSGAELSVIEGTTVTLKFGEDERASGSTGCNSYSCTYGVRGDTLSFGRMISTRRACLDQRANQQEQRYVAALESANRFRLAENGLTIYYDAGRSVLNFVNTRAAAPESETSDDRSSPVSLLTSYYNAINMKEYGRAFRFWETPTDSLEQFTRGFADTERVRLLVEPPSRIDGAAGSLYAEIPTILVARHRNGTERIFAGCYVLRRSNVRSSDGADDGWHIYKAKLRPAGANVSTPTLLDQTCRD